MKLTPNFALEEFEIDGPMPDECVPSYTTLCHLVLEPTREQFGEPIEITSGWRDVISNKKANGDPHSEHMATKDYCAADWKIVKWRDLRPVFDWIRRSNLPFHIITLEHNGENGEDIIHISWNRFSTLTTREAKEGATNNREAYLSWPTGPGVSA